MRTLLLCLLTISLLSCDQEEKEITLKDKIAPVKASEALFQLPQLVFRTF